MADFTLSATTTSTYDDTLAAVRVLLVEAGFGVLTEIDIKATLKAKLDVEVAPQIILGACRPQLAHVALQAAPSIAALLPCNVVVRALDGGGCLVEAVDPDVMMSVAGSGPEAAALRTVALDARERLTSVLDGLPGRSDVAVAGAR